VLTTLTALMEESVERRITYPLRCAKTGRVVETSFAYTTPKHKIFNHSQPPSITERNSASRMMLDTKDRNGKGKAGFQDAGRL